MCLATKYYIAGHIWLAGHQFDTAGVVDSAAAFKCNSYGLEYLLARYIDMWAMYTKGNVQHEGVYTWVQILIICHKN